jgi:hypothetical protein
MKRFVSQEGMHGFGFSRCFGILVVSLIACALIFPPGSARVWAAQVRLTWNSNTEEDLAGYKVYYGVSSRDYHGYVDVGNQIEVAVPGLEDGVTYYFAATAYDLAGNEGGYSNEVVYVSQVSCAYSITPTGLSFGGSGGTGVVNVSTPASCTWTVVSNAPWIVITSNSSGTGNGSVTFSVMSNTGSASRTGTVTVAGNTFTVTQLGISQYRLSVTTSGTGTGTVTTNPSGTIFNAGTVVTLTATPDVSSTFAGWSGGVSGTSPTVSLTMNGDIAVTATFALRTYTITATAGPNGSISPQGTVTVGYGANQSFTITPNPCYEVANVTIDGASVGAVTSYTFNNVTANHTLNASFVLVPPEAATLVSPTGKISDTTPIYTWNAVPGATKYYLFVNDATGSRIRTSYTATQSGCASGTGTCSITPSTVLTLGTVKWWIQTWNTAGYGPWSSSILFTLTR